MNQFMTVTSLMLFWAFYEMSGGTEFTPGATAEAANASETVEPFEVAFEDFYVPFNAPVIHKAETAVAEAQFATPSTNGVTQASFTETTALTTRMIGEPAVIRTLPQDLASNPQPAALQQRQDIRIIAGDRVNMRSGPGTSFDTIGTFPQGTEAEVLTINDQDWAQIRLLETDQTGWMAAWLLSD